MGTIPPSFFYCGKFVTLDLSYNVFNGSIPSVFANSFNGYNSCAFPNCLQERYLQGKSPIEQDLSSYIFLWSLLNLYILNDMAQNDFKGLIPQDIKSLNVALVMLNLSWN